LNEKYCMNEMSAGH